MWGPPAAVSALIHGTRFRAVPKKFLYNFINIISNIFNATIPSQIFVSILDIKYTHGVIQKIEIQAWYVEDWVLHREILGAFPLNKINTRAQHSWYENDRPILWLYIEYCSSDTVRLLCTCWASPAAWQRQA